MSAHDWYENRLTTIEHRANHRERVEEAVRQIQEDRRNALVEGLKDLTAKPEPLYRIMTGDDTEALEFKVDLLLSLGWEIKGGVTMKNNAYVQAMFKPANLVSQPEEDNHFNEVDFNV